MWFGSVLGRVARPVVVDAPESNQNQLNTITPTNKKKQTQMIGDSLCAFCSRMKRGLLYTCCQENKCVRLRYKYLGVNGGHVCICVCAWMCLHAFSFNYVR